jgi:hypothetical protein
VRGYFNYHAVPTNARAPGRVPAPCHRPLATHAAASQPKGSADVGTDDTTGCRLAPETDRPPSLAKRSLCRHTPEVGAVCGKAARTVLGGGRAMKRSSLPYPTRPLRLIAPFPAGGVVDLFSRLIGQPLSERLGQPVIIENRAGAGGNVGTEAVVRASPDGYTLLLITSTNAINQTLYDKLNFDFVRDIAPVATKNLQRPKHIDSASPWRCPGVLD